MSAVPTEGRRRRPSWVAVVGVAAVVLAVAVSGVVAVRWWTDPGRHRCARLSARVEGLTSFGWDNGITDSGSEWLSVLTDGVTQAADADRVALAAAVRADAEGYGRLRASLPDDVAPAADRLHVQVQDPAAAGARGRDVAVRGDVATLTTLGLEECGLV